MAKKETKPTKSPAQKAAPTHNDSEIKDLKSPDKNAEFGKVKGGAAKKLK